MGNSTPTYRTALVGCGGRGMVLLRTAIKLIAFSLWRPLI